MLSPATSLVTVGRSRELEALREAQRISLADIPQGVVITGEAGIGKSRLLTDFIAGLDPHVAVATGQCVAMGSVPSLLQPIRDVLRALQRHFGSEQLLESAGPSGRLLPAVLPELADEPAEGISQAQLHDAVSVLLQRLSSRAALAVVVEDVHWSDLSTLDLLRSLMRTLRRGRVLVVITYRDDDLRRDSPLQPLLLDLERAREMTHIKLSRLSAEEIAEQVRRIRGSDPAPDELARLVERSEGVPFFVEELLAAGSPDGALPETLRELLLARYARLTPRTRAVVRMLAVGGMRVEHRIVERVHHGEPDELDAAMREAIGEHLLSVDRSAYRFRHALSHEAVLGELLPGERSRLHARYAEALESDGDGAGSHAEIARHWRAAGDEPRSLAALVTAMHEARSAGSPLTAAELGEQALAIWSRVDDAETMAGCSLSQLFLDIARAYDAASEWGAMPTLERGLQEVPDDDVLGRALLLHESMIVRYAEALPGALASAQEALALLPDELDDEGEVVRAQVLTGLGIIETLERVPGGRGRLEEAVESSRALMERSPDASITDRARAELTRGLSHLSRSRATTGDVASGLEALHAARLHAGEDVHARLRHAVLALWLLHHLGEHEEALRAVQGSREVAASAGMGRGFGTEIALLSARALLAMGELDAVEEVARKVRERRPPRTSVAYCASVEAELHLLRDDVAAAAAVLRGSQRTIDDMRAVSPNNDMLFARLAAQVALAADDPTTAWREVERLWAWPEQEPGPIFPLLAAAAEVLATLRRASAEPPGLSAVEAEQRLRRAFDAVAVWDVADDWRAVFDAELSGLDGTGTDVAAWEAAAAAAARGRLPVGLRAHALRRLAEAQLHAGERDAAAAAVDAAAAVAEQHDLRREARLSQALATRARLESRRRHPQDGSTLTDRERQVLALIAQGLTNRQIGERLFISPKTSSVHVSAILRKLGAATRAQAAARASEILD